LIILVFSSILFSLLVYCFWPFTVDDTFITLRYSYNFASGYGPTYNPGFQPVEGYTSFLYMILMTIPHLFNLNAIIFAKSVGIIATLAYIVLSFKFVLELTHFLDNRYKYVPASVFVLIIVSIPGTTVHAVSGMETAFYSLLTIFFFYLTFIFQRHPERRKANLLTFIGLLLGLTRPEGNLIVGVGLLCILFTLQRKQKRMFITSILLFYILPGGIYFLWRTMYYGLLLPLPFYLKVTHQSFLGGLNDVIRFIVYIGIHIGILVLLSFLKLNLRLLIPSIISVTFILIYFTFPTHIMGYEWRYMFPIVPFISIIAAVGVGVLLFLICSLHLSSKRKNYLYSFCISIGICVLIFIGFSIDVARSIKKWRQYAHGLSMAHITLGKYLNEFNSINELPPNKLPSLAIADAGAVPYYSKWHTIDTYGLNELNIALSGKHEPRYIFSKKPDLLVLISSSNKTFTSPFLCMGKQTL